MSAPIINHLEEWDHLTPVQREQYAAYLDTWAIGQVGDVARYFERIAELVRDGVHPKEAITQADNEFEETT